MADEDETAEDTGAAKSAAPAGGSAAGTGRPADFTNTSPFKKKARKKDPAGNLAMTLGIIAIVACLGAMALSLLLAA